jgi:predicted membrane protein
MELGFIVCCAIIAILGGEVASLVIEIFKLDISGIVSSLIGISINVLFLKYFFKKEAKIIWTNVKVKYFNRSK